MHSILFKPRLFPLVASTLLLVSCGEQKSSNSPAAADTAAKKPQGKLVIAMLPKLINIDYFDACKRGAAKAAEELDVTLITTAPANPAARSKTNLSTPGFARASTPFASRPTSPRRFGVLWKRRRLPAS